MEEIDLDINNYELKDILNLFHIPIHFEEKDLKKAKGIVLRIHPDKSRLPSEYFLFYSKAYKMLYSVWEFRQTTTKNTEYEKDEYSEKDKKRVLHDFLKERDFNVWFNEEFEKNKIKTEADEGYGEWFESTTDENTMDDFEAKKKKQRMQDIIKYKEVEEITASASIKGENLGGIGNDIGSYSSDLFSKLPYQDLKKAHTETVIGVTDEDYDTMQKFNTVEEYKTFRNSQNMQPFSDSQSMQYLRKKTELDSESSSKRAYELARQTEQAVKNNSAFWSNLFLIKY